MRRLLALLLTTLLLGWTTLPALVAHADTGNLMANPSAETLNAGKPANWTPDSWGSGTSTLALTADAHSGSEALNVTTTARTSGDAKWMPDMVGVTAGQTYTYTDYSKATAASQLIAAYSDAAGTMSYYYLSTVQPSSTWQQNTVDLTAPAGTVKAAVLHILSTAGSLTTDDFSLTTQAPPVILPPPTNGNLIANPSLETANGAAPAGWQTDNWGTNAASFTYTTNDGHTGSASATVQMSSYTDGDAKWYFTPVSVQPNTQYTFSDYYKATTGTSLVARFDNGSGSYSYTLLANVAAASGWTQTTATFTTPSTAKNVTILHLLASVGKLQIDDASLTTATQAPAISITAPGNGSTVSGTVTIAATATSPSGIANVQLQLDGANLGNALTTAPYQYSWNTTAVSNGTHTLSAVLTPVSGSAVSATPVQVTVNNAAAGSNLIPNPSLETVTPGNSKLPLGWKNGSWGTNAATFSYPTSGHTGSRSIKAQLTSYTDGAAYWYASPQPVTGGQLYDFKDYYKSNTVSEIDASVTLADGSEQYLYLGEAFKSPNSWTKFETQFTVPAGATSITFYHSIFSVGYVTTDDYSLTSFSYQGFNRALVSITDDDGFASYYTNGLPVLQKYGLPSTAYIISSYVDNAPGYLSLAQLKGLYNGGVEIGSHSVTHPDLSTLTATQQTNELKNSQKTLQNWLGVPITDYAAPYGAYNQQIVTDAQQYYQTYRGVQSGYNAKNNFDPMNLQVQNIVSTTTVADIQNWLQQAAATNTWLILVYHDIDTNPTDPVYNTLPADFDAQMAAVKASGLTVKTVAQAMAELTPQL